MAQAFFGGLYQGLSEGLEKGRQRKLEREQLELQKKSLEARLKGQDADDRLKQIQIRQALTSEEGQRELAGLLGGEGVPTIETAPGDVPIGAVQPQGEALKRGIMRSMFKIDPRAAMQAQLRQEQAPTSLEALAVQHLQRGDQPRAQEILGMKVGTPPGVGESAERISQSIYGKPWAQLGQAEKQVVDKLVFSRQGEIAGARATAGAEARMEASPKQLLTPEESGKLGVPYGTKREGAFGQTALTTAARNTLLNMTTAESVLTRFDQLEKELKRPKEAMGRFGAIPGAVTGQLLQTDPNVVEYNSLAEGMLAAFSRSIGGERGQTTEQDVGRARQLIPRVYPIPDTQIVAKRKIDGLRRLIAEIKDRAKGGSPQQGSQPSNLPPPPAGWR